MHDSYDSVIFTWGKHSGHTLGHVVRTDSQYLHWMLTLDSLPAPWIEAARRAIKGETVEDVQLPRTKTSKKPKKQKSYGTDTPVTVRLKNKDTATMNMSYNKLMLEKFKYEIDGRTWNGKKKEWEFPVVHLPKLMKLFPHTKLSTGAKKKLKELQERREDLDEIRDLEDTDFDVEGLKLPLYPYQKVGVSFVDRAGGRCMIADAPGLGKTVQAIAYAQLHNLKTLIICPLSVVPNWRKEILKFTGKDSCAWSSKGKDGHGNHQFHIINYDAVRKHHDKLRDLNFDLMVCDEATYLKNRRTIRAKSILGYYKERRKYPGIKTKYVLFLTGTPVLSRPIEAFSLLNFLDKQRFNNFYHFTQRYGGWKGEPPKNLQDLHHRTKDVVIRRLKSQVLGELPDKQRNDLYVELSNTERKEYKKLLKEMFGHWRSSGKPSVQHMPKLQGFLSEIKLPRVIEMIDEFLDNDRSILIFSKYLTPLHKLKEHYEDKSAILTGSMKSDERQESIDKLTSGEAKVGLFSLLAAGMGIDGLQHKISTVVFLDMDWVPANHEQAEDRTHRVGQSAQVQAYYMVCENTIDEYMRDILREKQKVIDMIVDGELITPARGKSFFKEFVKRVGREEREEFEIEFIED